MRHSPRFGGYLASLAAVGLLTACSADKPVVNDEVSETQLALVDTTIPCEARAIAVTANTGGIMVNPSTRVDSYQSSLGPYGGSNVGQKGSIRAGRKITYNGGVITGDRVENSPSNLATVPVPTDAIALPLGSRYPGEVNINNAAETITLQPGSYVANRFVVA